MSTPETPPQAPGAPATPLEALISYVRGNYAPASPTSRLLVAYEALEAESERLKAANAAMRQALALANLDIEDQSRL